MEGKLKCCKTRETKYYICITCLSITHPSCLKNNKQAKIVSCLKIFCSKLCQEVETTRQLELTSLQRENDKLKKLSVDTNEKLELFEIEHQDKLLKLEQENNRLMEDIIARENHLQRERRKTQDVEDEAVELEKMYVDKTKEQLILTTKLRKKLEDEKQLNTKLQEQIICHLKEIEQKNELAKNMEEINKSMVETIRILENRCNGLENRNLFHTDTDENTTSQDKKKNKKKKAAKNVKTGKKTELKSESTDNKIKHLEDNNSDPKECNVVQTRQNKIIENNQRSQEVCPIPDCAEVIDRNNNFFNSKMDKLKEQLDHHRNKIRIYGDQYGKGFARLLIQYTQNKYAITSIIKPNAELTDLTANIFDETVQWGNNDVIVVMVNSKNISNKQTLNSALRKLLHLSRLINLLLIIEINSFQDEILRKMLKDRINAFKKQNGKKNCSFTLFIKTKHRTNKRILAEKLAIKIPLIVTPHNFVLKTVKTDNYYSTIQHNEDIPKLVIRSSAEESSTERHFFVTTGPDTTVT